MSDAPAAASAYESLEARARHLRALANALGILGWDRETMMPTGAEQARAEALATLTRLQHEALSDPAVADWLDRAEQDRGLDEWQAANVRELRRQWRDATAVPGDLLAANVKATSRAEMVWRMARREADFAALLPDLRRVLDLQREIGQARAEAFDLDVYDALMDQWEPGLSQARMTPIFEDLAAFLPDFIADVRDRQAGQAVPADPEGPFPIDRQAALGEAFVRRLGFDFDRGRLDVSAHPFTGGADNDVRITTRYDEADFTSSLMGVLHETGHALYEQGRPLEWLDQPVGASRGLGVHESQSLIIEMQTCRSRAFFDFAAPRFRAAFGGDGPAWQADNLHRRATRVAPGFIRVDADEVTYPAHIILRYRLERALVAGDLDLADLPAAWAAEMQDLLGLSPPDDAKGCLQDIHWSIGAWGYFPTYTVGAITAAQLMAAAREAIDDLEDRIAAGDFAPLVDWLRDRIHSQGARYEVEDLLRRATGRVLDPAVYKAHLRQRYLEAA